MIHLAHPLEDLRDHARSVARCRDHLRTVVDGYEPADVSDIPAGPDRDTIVAYDEARIAGARRALADADRQLAEYTDAIGLLVAEQLRTMARAFGGGYHPDTDSWEYTSYPDGYDGDTVEAVTEAAFAAGLDVYGIALDAIHEAVGA